MATIKEDEPLVDYVHRTALSSGYNQSKYVAEHLVREAAQRGNSGLKWLIFKIKK